MDFEDSVGDHCYDHGCLGGVEHGVAEGAATAIVTRSSGLQGEPGASVMQITPMTLRGVQHAGFRKDSYDWSVDSNNAGVGFHWWC